MLMCEILEVFILLGLSILWARRDPQGRAEDRYLYICGGESGRAASE